MAFAGPASNLVVAVIVIGVLITTVLPAFGNLYAQVGAEPEPAPVVEGDRLVAVPEFEPTVDRTVVEGQGMHFDRDAEIVLAVGRVGQRPDKAAGIEQLAGDVAAARRVGLGPDDAAADDGDFHAGESKTSRWQGSGR